MNNHTADKITSVPQKDTTLPFCILTSAANYTLCPSPDLCEAKAALVTVRRGVGGGGMGLGGSPQTEQQSSVGHSTCTSRQEALLQGT